MSMRGREKIIRLDECIVFLRAIDLDVGDVGKGVGQIEVIRWWRELGGIHHY